MYSLQNEEFELVIPEVVAIEKEQSEIEWIEIKESEIQEKYLSDSWDKIDFYDKIIAASCGILSGMLDIFWVGDFNLDRGLKWGSDQVNDFVLSVAKTQGYKGKEFNSDVIKFLEMKFPFSGDKAMKEFGGSRQHHLRDFTHHPSPIGLVFSIFSQITGLVCGTDTQGNFKSVRVNIPDIHDSNFSLGEAFLNGTVRWFFHLVSDMAGSSQTAGAGCGIPGPFLSLAKELSSIPFFKNKDNIEDNSSFSVLVSKLYNGTLLADRDSNNKIIPGTERRIDLRAELGIAHEIGRQMLPVIINECLVRSFYFIKYLGCELKRNNIQSLGDLENINWKNVIPFCNPKIARLVTISTGSFMMCDISHAAIASAMSANDAKEFGINMMLKVNYFGIGRFAIAITTDIVMSKTDGKGLDFRSKIYEKMQEKDGNRFKIRLSENGVFSNVKDVFQDAGKVLGIVSILSKGTPLGMVLAVYSCYKMIAEAEKDYQEARDNRIQTELECEASIQRIREYRENMKYEVDLYFHEKSETILTGFDLMECAINNHDTDSFMKGNAMLQELLGHEVQFTNQQEFDQLMDSDIAFKL